MNEMKNNWLMIACGGTALVAFLFLIFAAVYVDIRNGEVVNLLTGLITGIVGTMFSFYFGTSRSSEHKTQIMADKMKKDV